MQETIMEAAGNEENWQAFLEYKLEKQHLNREEEQQIREFIERKAYLPLCALWEEQAYPANYPKKRIVNKQGSQKKRIVYTFADDEGIFLKFIAFHLFRYDEIFCDNCYAFRREFGVWDAMRRIRSMPSLQNKYCLKVDIRNYFNSIDIDLLLDKLLFLKEKDLPLYSLFSRILRENHVEENGNIIVEQHGAMAGTPISPFFANIYLKDVDEYFKNNNIPYFRYSDDIILFADNMDELIQLQNQLYAQLSALKLTINQEKQHISKPGEVWEFLGFCYRNGEIDLSDSTIRKMKAKIKRKADALRRWQRQKGLSSEKAAIGFIRAMNHKFYGSNSNASDCLDAPLEHNDFTWSRWFFPNLTTDAGLRIIDDYLQEYIRYTVTGRHYKGNYRIRYETLKEWGYRSLVHEYYNQHK